MANRQIERLDDGSYRLHGDLDFTTVPQIWRESLEIFRAGATLSIDLAAVGRADSAGLALLIGWVKRAAEQGGQPLFKNIPAQLLAIARVSGVETMLPLPNQVTNEVTT